MRASNYVGRVGGLALALGLGAAAFTGAGVGWADSGVGSSESASSSSSASDGSGDSGDSSTAGASAGAGSGSSGQPGGADSGLSDSNGSPGSAVDADETSDSDLDSELSDSADLDEPDDADPADAGDDLSSVDVVDPDEAGGSDSDSSLSVWADQSADSPEADGAAVVDEPTLTDLAEFDDSLVAELALESAAVGVEQDTVQPTVVSQAAELHNEQPAGSQTAPSGISDVIATVAQDVLDPAASGDGPAVPADNPAEWVLAAAARRDLSLEPDGPDGVASVAAPDRGTAQVAANLFSNPITVAPVVPELQDGILLGVIAATSSRGFELSYTVVDDPSGGGKTTLINSTKCQTIPTCASAFPTAPADAGNFTLLPELAVVDAEGTTEFGVRITENTPLNEFLAGLPLVGALMPLVIDTLHEIPIVNDLLAPLIGYTLVQDVTVDVGALAPAGTPVAFTTHVLSVDDALISMNYYPKSGQAASDPPAPTVLNGPGLGDAGNIDVFGEFVQGRVLSVPIPDISTVREDYNYVSWDPRGEHASTGILQLDNPFFEGRDVSHIIDFLVAESLTASDGTTPSGAPDPLIGMLGGSYGGGIQWVVAGIDQRVDAIVPTISWHSLNEAIYPGDVFKTGWADLLYLDLVLNGATINSQIPTAILTGNLFAWVSEAAQAVLTSSGPTVLVESITAPSLLLQGTIDLLFVLEQSIQNGEITDANGVPTKMIWGCFGHGVCTFPLNDMQDDIILKDTMDWLDRFLLGETPPEAPNFQFFDQSGDYFFSDLFPFDPAFIGGEIVTEGDGGFLPIFPIIGGSGPSRDPIAGVFSPVIPTEANNALNLDVDGPEVTQIVGTPEVSFTYSGLGTAHYVYGQIVDESTGMVLGNMVKPIPVTLDGKEHSVSADLENIVYTGPVDSLKLQLVASATPYQSFAWGAWGGITVSDLELKLPTVADGVVTPGP